ncbi:MAG: prephenate dehydrogenase/arogenate dehydrogenase family protein [Methanoculleaceae archaeon]
MDVGIIGGYGGMGSLFAGVFERAGHRVLRTRRSTSHLNKDLARSCDIVMISVPIRQTLAIIREVAPLMETHQLLCDLTSLKVEPVRAMCESEASVLGLHPMFGPTVSTIRGQIIIATPARCDPETQRDFLDIFRREGAEITLTTPEEHDRMMAIIQGLIHTMTICLAETIRRSGVDVRDTLSFTSPVYRINIAMIGRLLSQDPELYADLITMNPHTSGVLELFNDVAREIGDMVERGDADGLIRIFTAVGEAFGDFTAEAARETDRLIEMMVKG